jgi:hemin uptake protein HemP
MPTRRPEPPHSGSLEPGSRPGRSCLAQDALSGALPRYTVEQLFAGARQLVIVHGDREYRLRLTAANKLILTA